MNIRTGIDIVDVRRFEKAIGTDQGDTLLARVFLPAEMHRSSGEHLAGIFAAKEAVIKALSIAHESWLLIEITADPSGKPHAVIGADVPYTIVGCDISIAHDGGMAIAQCVALIAE